MSINPSHVKDALFVGSILTFVWSQETDSRGFGRFLGLVALACIISAILL